MIQKRSYVKLYLMAINQMGHYQLEIIRNCMQKYFVSSKAFKKIGNEVETKTQRTNVLTPRERKDLGDWG